MNTAVRHDELLAEMGWVQRLARRLLLDASRGDDAAQEALTRALTSPAPRPRRGPALRAFLATTTRVVARDLRRAEARRSRREQEVARPEATGSTAQLVERAACAQTLIAAVEALDEPYRSAVSLRYLEQLSVREVATRTGAQPVTVRKRLSRGLAMLRARLEAEWGGAPGAWAVALLPLAGKGALGRSSAHGLLRIAAVFVAALGSLAILDRVTRVAPLPSLERAPLAAVHEAEPVTEVATARTEATPVPASAPRALALELEEEGLDQNLALLAAAFSAMHEVGRVGEVACAAAAEQASLDCASCHGDVVAAPDVLPDEGVVLLRYEDGSLRAQGEVVHGERHGEWTEWFPGGEVAARGPYFDGERHGWWDLRHPGGERRAQGAYLYGRREGEWVEYDSAGIRRETSSWRAGARHGVQHVWHTGQVLASEVRWHAGERQGTARSWHPDGTLAREGHFERGVPQGPWQAWDEEGRPARISDTE